MLNVMEIDVLADTANTLFGELVKLQLKMERITKEGKIDNSILFKFLDENDKLTKETLGIKTYYLSLSDEQLKLMNFPEESEKLTLKQNKINQFIQDKKQKYNIF